MHFIIIDIVVFHGGALGLEFFPPWFRKQIKTENGFMIYNNILVGTEPLSGEQINIPEGIVGISRNALCGVAVSNATINIPSSMSQIFDDALAQIKGTIKIINIARANGSILGAPWGADGATVNWTGSN